MAESFHTDSEVPAGLDFNDGVALSIGLYFTLAVDGTITHARFRAGATLNNTVKWALYRLGDSAQLGEQDITVYTAGAWNTVVLNTPISVVASTRYAAVFWSQNSYVSTGGYFGTSITRGNITAEANGGHFIEPSADIAIPTSNFNNSCYFVDFSFTAAGATPTVLPTGISVPVAVGQPSAAQTLTAAPNGIAVPVALGAPALTQTLTPAVAPAGISVPVVLGQPSVSGQPYVRPSAGSGGSWYDLLGIAKEARTIHDEDQRRGWIACPNDGEPLSRSRSGQLYCKYDGWMPPS